MDEDDGFEEAGYDAEIPSMGMKGCTGEYTNGKLDERWVAKQNEWGGGRGDQQN